MNKIFPTMFDRPNGGQIFCSAVYWMFCFVIFPFIMIILIPGFQDHISVLTWIELIFYIVNAVILVLMFREYLVDSFYFQVQDNLKSFSLTIAATVGLMIAIAGIIIYIGYALLNIPLILVDHLPMSEMSVKVSTSLMLMENPLWSTLCLALLNPFSISILFYALAFAPICCERPWLAYLIMPFVLALPCAFNIFWRGQAIDFLTMYIVQLPFHMLACWSYQKANTIWAPIASLAIFNLLSCAGILVLEHLGYIWL